MSIKGITVTLYEPTQTGTDALNKPIYTDIPASVDNVLVAPMSEVEQLETFNLTGRKAIYQLGIPKGDTHVWKAGMKVGFFGEEWRIVGKPVQGIIEMIPLSWNMKVRVERYEQD